MAGSSGSASNGSPVRVCQADELVAPPTMAASYMLNRLYKEVPGWTAVDRFGKLEGKMMQQQIKPTIEHKKDKHFSNVKKHTTKSALSMLLQRRKELQGEKPSALDEEKRLKMELKESRRKKEQKVQIREWLLEKEQRAERISVRTGNLS